MDTNPAFIDQLFRRVAGIYPGLPEDSEIECHLPGWAMGYDTEKDIPACSAQVGKDVPGGPYPPILIPLMRDADPQRWLLPAMTLPMDMWVEYILLVTQDGYTHGAAYHEMLAVHRGEGI